MFLYLSHWPLSFKNCVDVQRIVFKDVIQFLPYTHLHTYIPTYIWTCVYNREVPQNPVTCNPTVQFDGSNWHDPHIYYVYRFLVQWVSISGRSFQCYSITDPKTPGGAGASTFDKSLPIIAFVQTCDFLR